MKVKKLLCVEDYIIQEEKENFASLFWDNNIHLFNVFFQLMTKFQKVWSHFQARFQKSQLLK
jgi:hypothetical protein